MNAFSFCLLEFTAVASSPASVNRKQREKSDNYNFTVSRDKRDIMQMTG